MSKTASSDDETEIDARRAIQIAKTHVANLFSDEGPTNPTLEEIWYDEIDGAWNVTVGIRHRREHTGRLLQFDTISKADYKVVRISAKDGKIVSVKLREPAA